jgi:hypothetical protein
MKPLEALTKLVTFQKGSAKNDLWINSEGLPVERHRVTKAEAANERALKGIFSDAIKITKMLSKLRNKIDAAMKHCWVVFLTENGEVVPENMP